MHLYLIRHADPDYTVDGLTSRGHEEARALAERLKSHGLDYLYASQTKRAIPTAEPVSRLLDIPIIEQTWIIEPSHLTVEQDGQSYVLWDTFGELVRGTPDIPTQSDWLERHPFSDPRVREMWEGFRGKSDELIARHGYVREGGRYRIQRRNRDRIALISHNGTVLLFLAHLLELPVSLVWAGFYAWPSSVTTIFFEQHSDTWAVPRALSVADVSHLRAFGLEPQPRGMGGGRYEPYV